MSDEQELCLKCQKSIEGNGAIDGICPECQNGKKPNQTSKTLIKKAAIQADGSPTKMAEILGVTPSTAHHHLKKPSVQKAIQTAQEKALASSHITRKRVYDRLSTKLDSRLVTTYEGYAKESDAPDHKAQQKAIETALQLFGDLKKDGDLGGGNTIVNMPSIYIDNVELIFDVGEPVDLAPAEDVEEGEIVDES